ncbi:MAG: TlpA family protein disulfide reductase [Ignavibacteria bacterium]|nr:TlpA family protein disulfide reductase [Ignavibacteria bacterium]
MKAKQNPKKNIKQQPIQEPEKKKYGRYITWGIVVIILYLFIKNNFFSNDEAISNQDTSYAQPNPTTEVSKPLAPNFSLSTLDGKIVKLTDYKGKVVIIDFWATWCTPCRKGIPDLVDIQNRYKNVQVIGITLDQNPFQVVPPFAKEFKINYPILISNENVLYNYGGIDSIPTTFIIDKNGQIVSKHIGLVSKDVLENDIKKASL